MFLILYKILMAFFSLQGSIDLKNLDFTPCNKLCKTREGYDELAITFGSTNSLIISIKCCCQYYYTVLMIMTKFQSVSPISH